MLASVNNASPTTRLPYSTGTGEARDNRTGAADPKSTRQTSGVSTQNLTEDQLKQLESLKKRDTEVRAHEAAHQAAAGGLARGGASFSYQRGPDGQQYAIGGEVNIDTSPVPGNPEATLAKAQTIARAALAPAEPSGQDRQVATQAAQMAAQARVELSIQNQQPAQGHQQKSDRFKVVEASDRERPVSIDVFA